MTMYILICMRVLVTISHNFPDLSYNINLKRVNITSMFISINLRYCITFV